MAQTLDAPLETVTPDEAEHGPGLLTIEEFDRLPDDLFLEGKRIELIDGLIYTKISQNDPHVTAVCAVTAALQEAFGAGFFVSQQTPLKYGTHNAPEPDVTVLRGTWRDYDGRRPDPLNDVPLVVEVSDSSLSKDRRLKAGLYARAGLPEYWIVNLRDRTLEVYRKPEQGAYTETIVLHEGKSVAVGGGTVAVTDILPRAA